MEWMLLPILACVVIVLTLGWFGLHVLEREVIFVDLALAQVAALGTTWAVFWGHEADSALAFGISLLFTFIGAVAFSAARLYEERVPQEAIIGIAYAVSAAFGILLVHFADDPHGGEKIEHLLVGNLVWIQPGELAVLAGVCAGVGACHAVLGKRLLRVTMEPEKLRAEGVNIGLWDVFFYLTFGLALAAIVSAAGVLLVFSYLVIPAVIARLFFGGVRARLVTAWTVGLLVSVAGVAVSYEHPIGPVIVSLFGVALLLALGGYAMKDPDNSRRTLGILGGSVVLVGLVLYGSTLLPRAAHENHDEHGDHDAGAVAMPGAPPVDELRSPDAAIRDAAARAAAGRPERIEAVAAAIAAEADESVRLTLAVVLTVSGDRRGLVELARLTMAEAPFVRMQADERLRVIAGSSAPVYDPLVGPDAAGVWAAWVAGLGGVPAAASGIALP